MFAYKRLKSSGGFLPTVTVIASVFTRTSRSASQPNFAHVEKYREVHGVRFENARP